MILVMISDMNPCMTNRYFAAIVPRVWGYWYIKSCRISIVSRRTLR